MSGQSQHVAIAQWSTSIRISRGTKSCKKRREWWLKDARGAKCLALIYVTSWKSPINIGFHRNIYIYIIQIDHLGVSNVRAVHILFSTKFAETMIIPHVEGSATMVISHLLFHIVRCLFVFCKVHGLHIACKMCQNGFILCRDAPMRFIAETWRF